jgi:hypothetical protein
MERIASVLRSFGNAGALANAARAVEARAAEEQRLEARLALLEERQTETAAA